MKHQKIVVQEEETNRMGMGCGETTAMVEMEDSGQKTIDRDISTDDTAYLGKRFCTR